VRLVGRRAGLPSLLAAEVCFADGIDLVCAHAGAAVADPSLPVVLFLECGDASRSATQVLDGLGAILAPVPVRASAVATDAAAAQRLWNTAPPHRDHQLARRPPQARRDDPTGSLATFPDPGAGHDPSHRPDARVVLFGISRRNLHVNVIGPAPATTRSTKPCWSSWSSWAAASARSWHRRRQARLTTAGAHPPPSSTRCAR